MTMMPPPAPEKDTPQPDTIVAISTPPGRGGIGVVRLAGPQALAAANALLRGPRGRTGAPLSAQTPHATARRAQVLDPADATRVLDEALVTVFHAPRSYTGDTLVEIATHGAPVVLEALLRGALAQPEVRPAQPGEFTRRAFLSGRLDLTQAEAVEDLIAAQTLDQARVAAQQMGGALSRQVAPAKGTLLHLIALLEAGMDFAAGELDDVEVVPPAQIARAIEETRAPLAELAATFPRGQLLRQGAALALVGPPNAGKSSLFNRLLERERAIVTPLPGTTRDTLEETLALGGLPLRLIDTAGLREHHADAAEAQGIARTREALADADLVLLVHDATLPLTDEEQALLAALREPGTARPHLLIANKVDLAAAQRTEGAPPAAREPALQEALRTSALTGEGLAALREAILAALGAAGSPGAAAVLNTVRQQQAVARALTALEAAAQACAGRLPHEVLLLDLHAALTALDELTGATTTEDILERIFATFCIGK